MIILIIMIIKKVVRLLVGDRSVVGRVGSDDSLSVHHVLASQIELTHFSQAEWRERKR